MHPQIIAALIAGVVSLIGGLVTIAVARWTLASARNKLLADIQALRQDLFKEVLGKRMNAYAALWNTIITFDLNWLLEGKSVDAKWSSAFLRELNSCNAEHGVFFSQSVYEHFVKYRRCLVEIDTRARAGQSITHEDLGKLEQLSAGANHQPGLATALKDDLGSYISHNLRFGTTPGDQRRPAV